VALTGYLGLKDNDRIEPKKKRGMQNISNTTISFKD
jgi:hypothetical protein